MLKKTQYIALIFALALSCSTKTLVNEYADIAQCLVVGKSITASVSCKEPSATASISIPDEWKGSFSITSENNRLTICQTAETNQPVPVEITLPAICDLACCLAANAKVSLVNPSTHKGALKIDLYSGGTVMVNGGTYTACSIKIYEHGFVRLMNERIESPVKLHIDGMGYVSFSEKLKNNRYHEKSYTHLSDEWEKYIIEGLYSANGAMVKIADTLSLKEGPNNQPIFSPVSLEALAAYEQGTQAPRPLPQTWALHLCALEQSGVDLSGVHSAKLFDELYLAEDKKMFGQQIRGLSYQEIRNMLLSPKRKEAILAHMVEKNFHNNDPYFKHQPFRPTRNAYDTGAMLAAISLANASPEEKLVLWNLFLHVELHDYSCTVETNSKKIVSYNCLSPHELYEKCWATRVEKTHAPRIASPSTTFKKNLKVAGLKMLGLSLFAGVISALDNKDKKKLPSFLLGGAMGLAMTGAILAPSIWNDFKTYKKNLEKTEPKDTILLITPDAADIKAIENFETTLTGVVEHLADKIPKPIIQYTIEFLTTLKEIEYKTSKGIDFPALKKRHKTLCEYFDECSKKALLS